MVLHKIFLLLLFIQVSRSEDPLSHSINAVIEGGVEQQHRTHAMLRNGGHVITPVTKKLSLKTIKSRLGIIATRAIGGGKSGAIAGAVQVLTMMWLRTIMNYQVITVNI